MRNGNIFFTMDRIMEELGSQPNYEEWKLDFKIEYKQVLSNVPSLTMRNGNAASSSALKTSSRVPSLTMRNGNILIK